MPDLDFSAISQELLAGSHESNSIVGVLKQFCPALVRQIETDANRRAMLRLWGDSVNIDENTDTVIVPVPLIETLGKMTRVTMRHPIVHAGITHTYGYLFSLINTPYGWKRDRWVKGEVASILGMNESVLSPRPGDGTLLSNVTYAMGRIAFRGRRREQRILRTFRACVNRELQDYAYGELRGFRIVETIPRSQNSIQLQTELIESRATNHATRLLLYWWSDGSGDAKLITAFPISAEFVEKLLASERFSADAEITLRYNGYLAKLPNPLGQPFRGMRSLYTRGSRFRRIA